MRSKFLVAFTAAGLVFLASCEDTSTDPNDPRFRSPEQGITLQLENLQQTVHHFGASDGWSAETIGENWPDSEREKVAELLFSQELDEQGKPKGIGLSMWRTNIGAGSANQPDNGFADGAWFRATECPLLPDGTWDWSQGQGTRWFINKAKEHGVDYLTGWVTSPPYFMTKNGYTFITPGTGGYNLQPDKYDDFAAYLSEYVQYYESLDIPLDFISPINEPQYEWSAEPGAAAQEGSRCSNAEAFTLVQAIDQQFQADGVNAKLILPESGDIESLYAFKGNFPNASDQGATFWDPSSDEYLGNFNSVVPFLAGHSYWSNSSPNVAIGHREELLRMNQSLGLEFWQTEYSILGSDYQREGSPSELIDIDYALWAARIVHWDLTIANATGWSWWTSMSRAQFSDHKFRFGLTNWYPTSETRSNSGGEVEESKMLWMFGNFSRFVRPGYQRIEVTNDLFSSEELEAENLMVSSFLSGSGDELVIILINYSQENIEVPILNYGTDGGFSVEGDVFNAYVTNQTFNLQPSEVPFDEIAVRGRSIMTLVGKL